MDDSTQLFQFVQSIFIGLIFSFLLAKLISVVVSFRDEKLSISRSEPELESSEPELESSEPELVSDDPIAENPTSLVHERVEPGTGESDSDDDWEGVESTELDEAFSAATAFVAAAAADRLSHKVSSDLQLQLYGLYKIATEGPCSVPQPSAFKMTARAKWQAWQKLGAMPTEEAMQMYISIITDLYPSWASGSTSIKGGDSSGGPSGDNKGPMGPVFSQFIHEEESGNELKMDAIHAFAREGDGENLLKCIESGVLVNLKDSEGRTPLHWAVDRGHLNITELLVSKNADINAKDNEGQSALHYAAVCDREAIAEFLVKQNADTNLKDEDGNTPYDLSDVKWPWLQLAIA